MQEQLKEKMAQLRASLNDEQVLDDGDIQNLKDLDRDIKMVLAGRSSESEQPSQDMEARIEQQAIAFDSQYPQLSAILRDVLDILSKMGI